VTKAHLDWSLTVTCPGCGQEFDVVEQDSCNDYVIAKKIFSNDWDAVEGCVITCEECEVEFELEGVEY
jgi:hypothetical protein